MTVQTRKITIADLDRVDQDFLLRTPTGEAFVTIVQAVGYQKSKVKIQQVLKGYIEGAKREETLDVPNEKLEPVLEVI